jgi:hypothetical protein
MFVDVPHKGVKILCCVRRENHSIPRVIKHDKTSDRNKTPWAVTAIVRLAMAVKCNFFSIPVTSIRFLWASNRVPRVILEILE